MSWLTPMKNIKKSRAVRQIASLKQHTQQMSLSTSLHAAVWLFMGLQPADDDRSYTYPA